MFVSIFGEVVANFGDEGEIGGVEVVDMGENTSSLRVDDEQQLMLRRDGSRAS